MLILLTFFFQYVLRSLAEVAFSAINSLFTRSSLRFSGEKALSLAVPSLKIATFIIIFYQSAGTRTTGSFLDEVKKTAKAVNHPF